jgi:hypothetical protein
MGRLDFLAPMHAFGERYELPIPLYLFVLGGVLVVIASFVVTLRRTLKPAAVVDVEDVVPALALRPVPAAIGLLLTVAVGIVGVTGLQEISENIAPTYFWLLIWIGVPLSCGLLGDWTRPWNPFANAGRLGDSAALRKAVLARTQPLGWSARVGWWPAVVMFVLLVLGELVFNKTTTTKPAFVGTSLLVYLFASFVMGLVFGPAWLSRGEVFSALFNAWGRLGFWRHGAPGRRGFAGGLDVPFQTSWSRVVFVLLLLISINFDGLLATPQWASYECRTFGVDARGIDGLRVVSLLALVVVVLAVFLAFAVMSAKAGKLGRRPIAALADLLPSLVPIAYGYLIAHYLEYLIVNGQLLVPLLDNPGYDGFSFGLPSPFNDSYEVHRTVLPTSFYWYLSVGVIVAVHVAAVLLANRRLAGRAATKAEGRRAEYPWLVAMVGYTAFSLFLIAQPLTEKVTQCSGF